jgi:hypothetical protein
LLTLLCLVFSLEVAKPKVQVEAGWFIDRAKNEAPEQYHGMVCNDSASRFSITTDIDTNDGLYLDGCPIGLGVTSTPAVTYVMEHLESTDVIDDIELSFYDNCYAKPIETYTINTGSVRHFKLEKGWELEKITLDGKVLWGKVNRDNASN